MNPLGGRGAFESGYFINGQGYFHQDIPDTPRPNLMIMNRE